jgi:hypothetical protein
MVDADHELMQLRRLVVLVDAVRRRRRARVGEVDTVAVREAAQVDLVRLCEAVGVEVVPRVGDGAVADRVDLGNLAEGKQVPVEGVARAQDRPA